MQVGCVAAEPVMTTNGRARDGIVAIGPSTERLSSAGGYQLSPSAIRIMRRAEELRFR